MPQDNITPKNKPPTILAVLAHPDDETFGMGGTLALYAQKSADIYLICATRGEAGDVDKQHLEGFNSIAELRTHELQCASKALGIKKVFFLNYRDSGMQDSADNTHSNALVNANLDEVAEKVAHIIRELRPHVVLTFDPVGGYKHPDHIAIHKATVKAFDLAASRDFQDGLNPYQPQKLYFQIMPKRMIKFMIRLLPFFGKNPRQFGRNHDIDLVSIVENSDFPVHLRVNIRSVRAQKDAAAACHASQQMEMSNRPNPIRWFLNLLGDTEEFMRYYPPAEPDLREKDLFEGINF